MCMYGVFKQAQRESVCCCPFFTNMSKVTIKSVSSQDQHTPRIHDFTLCTCMKSTVFRPESASLCYSNAETTGVAERSSHLFLQLWGVVLMLRLSWHCFKSLIALIHLWLVALQEVLYEISYFVHFLTACVSFWFCVLICLESLAVLISSDAYEAGLDPV